MENRCCTSNYNSHIPEYATVLLTSAFVVQNCLYVMDDDCPLSNSIKKSLMNIMIPAVAFSECAKLDLNCEGYVIVSNNFSSLQHLFAKVSRFEVQKRVVIFFDGQQDFLTKPFTLLSARHAVDIYVVQGLWNNPNLEMKDLEVIDVYKQKKINEREFEQRTWWPDFTVEPSLKFTAAVFNCSPFVMINFNRKVFDGVEHKILREITEGWPFEYRIHTQSFEKDLYMELSYDILNGTSDIGLGYHWLTFTLLRNVDTSYPYTQACATFLVPKSHLLPNTTFVFQPVTRTLWLTILIIIFLAALSLFTAANYYAKHLHIGNEYGFDRFAICFMNLLAILVINTLKRFPPANLSVFRFIITSWCFICVVLSTGYSAGFSSLLTYPRFWKHINTLQDMIDASIYWGEASTFTRDVLASSEQTKLIKLASLFRREDTQQDKLFRLRQNTHATIVTVLPKRFLTGTFILDDYAMAHLKVLSECFGLYYVVFALPKNSPYKKLIQEKIIQYTEHGFIAYWYTEILTKYDYMHVNNFYMNYAEAIPTQHVPLAINKIQGAFLLLMVGLICSTLTFLAETVFLKIVRSGQIPKRCLPLVKPH